MSSAMKKTPRIDIGTALLPGLLLTVLLCGAMSWTMASAFGANSHGPTLGSAEIPAATISGSGGVHEGILPAGAVVTIDFSLGGLHLGSGTGAGNFSVLGGYQAQREAIEERTGGGGTPFRRGEANGDGVFDISDAVITFERVLLGGIVNCRDAADADDDGRLGIADGIWMLSYLFSEGEALPAPGSSGCGPDPTDDALDCLEYDCP